VRRLQGQTSTQANVPVGQTHLSFVLCEAEAAFQMDRKEEAVGNLIHAIHVAVMTDEESAAWFRRLTDASGWTHLQ
jgi:hypothetical protein